MKKVTIEFLPGSPQQQQQPEQQRQQPSPLKKVTWEKRLHKGPHKDMLELHQVSKSRELA
jgi:hypothetical protein